MSIPGTFSSILVGVLAEVTSSAFERPLRCRIL